MIIIYILLWLLSSTESLAEKIHFKGNLLFRETGANYLNQEHMIFARILDTNDLRIFAQTLQESSNAYESFCDSITRLFYQTNQYHTPPANLNLNKSHTIIASSSPHSIAEAAAVCRSMGARLPEIRTREDDRDLLEAVEKFKVKTVLAGIQYDIRTNKFTYKSDLAIASENTIYGTPYYGGVYTNKWHQATSWTDTYLITHANDYYLTYVKARDGMAFRLSDSNTLNEQNIILCQKSVPNLPPNFDQSTSILIQMTMGYCTRESTSITGSTNQAIEQIKLITSINLDIDKNKTNNQYFLPNFRSQEKLIKGYFPQKRRKRQVTKVAAEILHWSEIKDIEFKESNASKCLLIKQSHQLWTPLFVENEVEIPVNIYPNISNKVNTFMEKTYNYWFHARASNDTLLTYQDWLDSELIRKRILMCSTGFGHFGFNLHAPLFNFTPKALLTFERNPLMNEMQKPPNPFNKNMKKRDLATITGASVIGTFIGSSAYIIKSFIDLFSGDKYVKKAEFRKVAKHINDIRINQVQLQDAVRQLTNRVSFYEDQIKDLYNGAAAQSIEVNLKYLNRYLQMVLTNTLANYAQAFLAAMDGKTSPYALSGQELKDLSTRIHAEQRVTLDTNINNVRTTAMIYNNTIRFFFEIPIIADESAFYFYSIIPVPAFQNNETFWPDIDATNIAISVDGTKYSTLTPDESSKCMSIPPVCQTHKPISPVTNKALCVVSTYTTSSRTCKMKSSSSIAEPFLHFEDNNLYFSVPYNTTMFISCPPTKTELDKTEATIILSGMGQAQYRPACTITLQDGTSHKTASQTEIHNLSNWPLFNILTALPHNVEIKIQVSTLTPFVYQSISPIEDTYVLFSDTLTKTESKVLEVLLTFLAVLIPIACTITIALCYKDKFVKWIRSLVYHGSYTLDKEQNVMKDDFSFLTIPLTPKLEDKSNKFSKYFFTDEKNLTSSSYQRAPMSDPTPPPQSAMKTPKNVHFQNLPPKIII